MKANEANLHYGDTNPNPLLEIRSYQRITIPFHLAPFGKYLHRKPLVSLARLLCYHVLELSVVDC